MRGKGNLALYDIKMVPGLRSQKKKAVGIDIGSTTGKAVLLSGNKIYTAMVPTGVYMQPTADRLLQDLFRQSGSRLDEVDYIVGTGYGRIALQFDGVGHREVTEISCHAMGAHCLNPRVKTIIDIGGQDSKAIKIDPKTGKVLEFIMNDKCAAGTGRFLEKAAYLLNINIADLGKRALQSQQPADISSQCVVFAESEVISLRAKGVKAEDIAAGIHLATARRILNLLNRIGIEPEILFTGGVSNNAGMVRALEQVLNCEISGSDFDTVYAGALGAAIFAQKYAETQKPAVAAARSLKPAQGTI